MTKLRLAEIEEKEFMIISIIIFIAIIAIAFAALYSIGKSKDGFALIKCDRLAGCSQQYLFKTSEACEQIRQESDINTYNATYACEETK